MHKSNKITNHKTKLITYGILAITALIIFIFGGLQDNKKIKQSVNQKKDYIDSGYSVVHFLDAGQGDCTVIETVDNKVAVIDASTQSSSDKITMYLKKHRIKDIEYLIFTHPHEDHIGGGDEILNNFIVKNVIMTDTTQSTSSYKTLIDAINNSKKKHGTRVIRPKMGDSFRLSDTVFTVISDGKGYDDINNSSICLKMECGKSAFLFTGDAEKEVEKDILKRKADIRADVFKCAHHGSSTSNTDDFLDAINPSFAIVSCGKDNDYGHPHEEVIISLNERDIKTFVTHEQGDILIGYNSDNIFIA